MPEKSSAFTLMHVSFGDGVVADRLDQHFEGDGVLCRYHEGAWHSSVAWLRGLPEPVELAVAAGEVATLVTILESGMESAAAILICMQACVKAIDPEMRRSMKTRRHQHGLKLESTMQYRLQQHVTPPAHWLASPSRLVCSAKSSRSSRLRQQTCRFLR